MILDEQKVVDDLKQQTNEALDKLMEGMVNGNNI